jgi:hypothetical protein
MGVAVMCASSAIAQTPEEITQLVNRLIQLDSIDIANDVKFRPGLEPPLHTLDADESQMTVLKDPYEVHGQGKPAAVGWYRVSFVVPEKLGKFAIPQNGYNCGVETNVLGAYEQYAYINGKPAGLWSKDGMSGAVNQHPTHWQSNAPMPTKAGDQITLAILARSEPLGRGSPEGFGLRHLRLRFALGHTAARQPFYGRVDAPGVGHGLLGSREKLATLKGDELTTLQAKLQGPLSRMDAVFAAADSGVLDNLTKAMMTASQEINEAMKK